MCEKKNIIEMGEIRLKIQLSFIFARTNTNTKQMLAGHESAGLMGIIAYLMQRNQLVRKRIGRVLVNILVLEADRIVEIWTLGHWMMTE